MTLVQGEKIRASQAQPATTGPGAGDVSEGLPTGGLRSAAVLRDSSQHRSTPLGLIDGLPARRVHATRVHEAIEQAVLA